MSSDSTSLTVNTMIPVGLIDGSFEGFFLKQILSSNLIDDEYYFTSADFTNDTITFDNKSQLKKIIALAEEANSATANAYLPSLKSLFEESSSEHKDIEFVIYDAKDPNGNPIHLDYIDILHDIVKRNPEELPCVEVQYNIDSSKLNPGRIGGGAYFITTEGIKSVDARVWLDEQRASFEASRENNASTTFSR